MSDRRVLVVAYYFPPLGGVGVQRTLKFVEHLPTAGWQPVVVAPRGATYRVMDPSSVELLPPGLEVHRALSLEPARIRAAVRGLVRIAVFRGRRRRGSIVPRPAAAAGPDNRRPGGGPRRWLNLAWRAGVRALFVPDEQMAWIPAAARTGVRVDRRQPVEVLYSSSPPASTHLAAGLIKALTGRPWVADFRDPWVGNAFASPPSPLHRAAERWLEQWVIARADRVVFATPGLLARYASRYPTRSDRFVTITNGYDRAELGEPEPHNRGADEPFRLVYAGSVYGEQELRIFLDGLALATERRPNLSDQLRVEFVGWMTPPNKALAARRAAKLEPILSVAGQVPRSEALARLRSADASLLLLGDGPDRDLFVGAKLFEAIGLDRQLLAMAPPGDTRDILAELDWGVVADPEPSSVADALLRLLDSPPPEGRADPTGRYERSRLAARLADVLAEAATPRAEGGGGA